MTSCLQAILIFFAAGLVVSNASEVDIENHPAFKVEDIPVARSNNTLRVASFNIQVFGVKKMENFHVVTCLTKILIRYDITLIEEIRDESDTAIHELLQKVNSMGTGTYSMALSGRLGRSTSKEQYAYFYKTSVVSVVSSYQWPAGDNLFERSPYIVRFRAKGHAVGDFGFIGIHVKPDDAVNEIDKLTDVYNTMTRMWNLQDFIVGGDFNAGCTYVKPSDWKEIRLRQDSRFLWLIGDNVDTTSKSSNCAYDRLVLAGSRLRGSYFTGTATAYDYETELGISHKLALDISDHFPVEMSLN